MKGLRERGAFSAGARAARWAWCMAWHGMACTIGVCPVERRMQSVCPVEGACNRFALWRAHGGDVTHEGIRGAVTPLCVATSRANCTEYWAPSPVCRVIEGERLHGRKCGLGLVGENRALRLARVGIFRASSTDAKTASGGRGEQSLAGGVYVCEAMLGDARDVLAVARSSTVALYAVSAHCSVGLLYASRAPRGRPRRTGATTDDVR